MSDTTEKKTILDLRAQASRRNVNAEPLIRVYSALTARSEKAPSLDGAIKSIDRQIALCIAGEDDDLKAALAKKRARLVESNVAPAPVQTVSRAEILEALALIGETEEGAFLLGAKTRIRNWSIPPAEKKAE